MVDRSTLTRWGLRALVVGYLGMLIAWPLALVVQNTFADGLQAALNTLTEPTIIHALLVTAEVAALAVLINLVFGVGISLLLVRSRFPGRKLLSALVDLPLSVSPVVVGLALVLVYNGRTGWFGPALEAHGLKVIFALPSMVMATAFVALPLVVREVVPTLEEIGQDQEQAARSLGANTVQTFRRITLPSIKWAVVYGVVLSLARAIGEYGAVKVVSGNVVGQTQTATNAVEQQYQNFQQTSAYAIAFLLALTSVVCIVIVSALRPGENRT